MQETIDFQSIYGEIRSTLQEPPSQQRFGRIAAQVEALWREDAARAEGEIFPYVERALSAWPHEARRCPEPWKVHLKNRKSYLAFRPLRLIRSLDTMDFSVNVLRGLFKSELAQVLRRLDLTDARAPLRKLQALSQATELELLEQLQLRDQRGPLRWIDELYACEVTHQLDTLTLQRCALVPDLHGTDPGEDLVRAEYFADHFPRLESLSLRECPFTWECVLAMITGEPLTQLHSIDISASTEWPKQSGRALFWRAGELSLKNFDTRMMQALFGAPWLGKMTSLSLEQCATTGAMHEAFGALFERAPGLCKLAWTNQNLDLTLVETLGESWRARLEELALRKLKLEPRVSEQLLHGEWRELTALDLGRSTLNHAFEALCAPGVKMPKLERLGLRRTRASGAQVRTLASASFASRLTELDVGHNDDVAGVLRELLEGGEFAALRRLDVSHGTASRLDQERLAQVCEARGIALER